MTFELPPRAHVNNQMTQKNKDETTTESFIDADNMKNETATSATGSMADVDMMTSMIIAGASVGITLVVVCVAMVFKR